MRKSVSYTILILSLFLVACGRNRPQENEYHPLYQSYETNVYFCTTTTVGEGILHSGEHEPTEPTIKDLLLYDLDYLLQLFEDTFPYINVLYRTSGVDIRMLVETSREIIENYPYSLQEFASSLGIAFEDMPELDAQVFWGILLGEIFNHISPFAHARLTHFFNLQLHSSWNRDTSIPRIRFNRRAFDNIQGMLFYREMDSLWNYLAENDLALLQFYSRLDLSPNEGSETRIPNAPVITTKILEEGRIAYLHIPSFNPPALGRGVFDTQYRSTFVDFYHKIQDYEHLIIDIRNNTGGCPDLPIMYIMLPLSLEPDNLPNMPFYVLYTDSERGRHFSELNIESFRIPEYRPGFIVQSDSPLSIEEILNSGSLSYLNQDDSQLLAYGFRVYLCAVRSHNSLTTRYALPHIPFNGHVWLLTCGRNYSASAMFARFARYTGFATLVGETVGGAYAATIATPLPLPNTGIVVAWDIDYITDEYGRALNEFPTQPHYFNRPGMDALETVLSMIAESRGRGPLA